MSISRLSTASYGCHGLHNAYFGTDVSGHDVAGGHRDIPDEPSHGVWGRTGFHRGGRVLAPDPLRLLTSSGYCPNPEDLLPREVRDQRDDYTTYEEITRRFQHYNIYEDDDDDSL